MDEPPPIEVNPYAPPQDLSLESAAEYRRWWTREGEWAEFRFIGGASHICRMFRRHASFRFAIFLDGEQVGPARWLLGMRDIAVDGHRLQFVGNLLTGRIDVLVDGKSRCRTLFPLMRILAPLAWGVLVLPFLLPGLIQILIDEFWR